MALTAQLGVDEYGQEWSLDYCYPVLKAWSVIELRPNNWL